MTFFAPNDSDPKHPLASVKPYHRVVRPWPVVQFKADFGDEDAACELLFEDDMLLQLEDESGDLLLEGC